MLNPIQRKLEIGSHSERLRAVRELGQIHTREAYELLQLAAEDIDPQIQDEARRLMRESVWDSGAGSGSSSRHSAPTHAIEEGLFG